MCVCACKIVYHGIRTWSRVRTKAKIWNWAEVRQGEREWEDHGNNELEVPMGSKSCWREDTGVSVLKGHDVVVREWRL